MKNNLGIYIHVPFCASKCAYCDFYSLSGQAGQMDAYVNRLLTDIRQSAPQCTEYFIDTIYFGGGTPSLLGGKHIAQILQTIYSVFSVDSGAEITVEANPDSMTNDFLSAAYRAGVNRLSIGIQSAHEEELRAIGRIHTFAQAQDAFYRARSTGFDNLSADLMYALPNQSIEQFKQSIHALLALQPEHLSCYGLTLEPHTPLARANPILPDEDTQADMYLMLCGEMEQAGFHHYEISNFARPGYESRHNSRYWKQSPYLGFGPGAHADFQSRRTEIPCDLSAWLAGSAPLLLEDTEIDRAAEYIMLSLRTSDGWDAEQYASLFHKNPKSIIQSFSALPEQYITHTGSRWHLTDIGFLISNTIILNAMNNM